MSLLAEVTVVVFGILLALVAPRSLTQTRSAAGRAFRAIGRSNSLTLFVAFVIPLVILPTLTLRSGIPQPYVHDEFVYLLMGETFSRGELTNPTPDHVEHFRSPHLIFEPTYQGKYPAAQGVFLAVGQLLTGRPIAGVWLSFACASAALCWMLQAWMPNRWALLGSVLFAFHPMISIGWGETYWGGATAVIGGSLLFGSVRRMDLRLEKRLGVPLAIGLIVLANSRPYEGLVASIPAAVWFAWLCWSWIQKGRLRAVAGLAATATVVLLSGFLLLSKYNQAVTGSPFKLPYQVWMEQAQNSKSVNGLLLDGNRSRETALATGEPGTGGVPAVLSVPRWQFKILRHHFFFLRIVLAVPLLAIPWLLRKRNMPIVVLVYCLVYACVVINQQSGWPHYYAPVTPLLFVLLLSGIRQMSSSGTRLRCLASVCTFGLVASGALAQWEWSGSPYEPSKRWVYARAQIEQFLGSQEPKQIVLVRYAENRDKGDEWVWNTGIPESQRVIWAHSLEDRDDEELLDAFSDRKAWYLDVGRSSCRLIPAETDPEGSQQEVSFTYVRDAQPQMRLSGTEKPESNVTRSAAAKDESDSRRITAVTTSRGGLQQ